jgi:hypothetical protein
MQFFFIYFAVWIGISVPEEPAHPLRSYEACQVVAREQVSEPQTQVSFLLTFFAYSSTFFYILNSLPQ